MNSHNATATDNIMLNSSGQLSVSRTALEELFQRNQFRPADTFQRPQGAQAAVEQKGPSRLAFTAKETAELLGVSDATVYRLLKRGLLRCSLALRTKLISKKEIERFLESSSSI